ncbi:MAG: hypothetical protein ACRDQ7_14060, partial [Haloechinothrix sp.]
MSGEQEAREYEGDVAERTFQESQANAPDMPLGLGNVVGTVRAVVDSHHAESEYRGEQGRSLARGQEFRGEQPHPDADYQGHSHEQLYDMVHVEMNPDDLDERGRAANAFGNWVQEVADETQRALRLDSAAWQGEAAEAAGSFMADSAAWLDNAGQSSYLISNQYSTQTEAAGTAKNSMPEPTGFSQEAEMAKVRQQAGSGNLIGAVSTYAAISEKQAEAQARHEEAARVMHTMDGNYAQSAGQQPAFSAPPTLGGGEGATFASSSAGGAYAGGPSVGGAGGAAGFAGGGSGGTPAAPGAGAISGSGPTGSSGSGSAPGVHSPAAGARPGGVPVGGFAGAGGLGRLGSETTRTGPRPGASRGQAGQRLTPGGAAKIGGAAPKVAGPGAAARLPGAAGGADSKSSASGRSVGAGGVGKADGALRG